MDNKSLQLFLEICKTLHFGKAGEQMHMSSSAVSRAIQRLEDEVGQKLFERDNRTVYLSDAGKQFQNYARQSIEAWQQFQENITRRTELLKGEISLYCSVTAAYSVLSGILDPFRSRYPDIEITLHTGDQAEALQRILEGEEDIAVAARPDKLSNRLQFQTLTYSPLIFIYPRVLCVVEQQIRDCIHRSVKPDWNEFPFIVSERGQARVQLDQWFRKQSIKPSIYAQVSGHEAIVSMVGLGFGVGVVPELVLANSPLRDQVQILDVRPALKPFAVGLCALKQHLDNPLVDAFWQCAKHSYRVEL